MAKGKGLKRGAKKGQTKPFRRPLDSEFPARLLEAMGRASYVRPDGRPRNSDLAKECDCERATIGQYLNGKKRTIDALLLLRLCDELSVTPYWLAKHEGTIEDVPRNKIPMEELRRPGLVR